MFICLKTDWNNGNYDVHLAVSFEPKHIASFLSAFSLMEWKQDETHKKTHSLCVDCSFSSGFLCWTWIHFSILIIEKENILNQQLHFPSKVLHLVFLSVCAFTNSIPSLAHIISLFRSLLAIHLKIWLPDDVVLPDWREGLELPYCFRCECIFMHFVNGTGKTKETLNLSYHFIWGNKNIQETARRLLCSCLMLLRPKLTFI